MKLYVPSKGRLRFFLAADGALEPSRLMSDYEVSLVNDNMQEFFVRFYGPKESTSTLTPPSALLHPSLVTLDHRNGFTDHFFWSCVRWIV